MRECLLTMHTNEQRFYSRSKLIFPSYVRACSDIKWASSRLPKIQPFGQSMLPQIQTICVRGTWWSAMLYSTHWPNTKKKPSHDGPFSFLVDPPLLARYPAVAGHCSLEPTPLKPHDAHIIFPMTPYLLHAIFPRGPSTTTLSAVIAF